MLIVIGGFKLSVRTDGSMRIEGDFKGGPAQAIDVPPGEHVDALVFMQVAGTALGEGLLRFQHISSEAEARSAAQQPEAEAEGTGEPPSPATSDDPAAP